VGRGPAGQGGVSTLGIQPIPDAMDKALTKLSELIYQAIYDGICAVVSQDGVTVDGEIMAAVKRRIQVARMHYRNCFEQWEATRNVNGRLRVDLSRRIDATLANAVHVRLDEDFNPRGFFVYILWGDSEDLPLYVGQSAHILKRLGQHMQDKEHLVKRVTVLRCPSRSKMDGMEARLISHYQPPMNKAGIIKPRAAA
jgi:hypothetical protein